tara:strand:- start:1599 stop:3878 length:2280 start_codon:yes stop_codon:yes gene_type:complete
MIESKSQLAKLLATEDITVRHSKEAKTASFDVKFRLLTLPNWVTTDMQVLDLMTGHEVGHALWTLLSDWEAALHNTEFSYHKGIINIVEDARIEKKIKRRYPGLVKSFVSGYRVLEQKEFFYPNGSDITMFNMADRLNLHFKLGALAGIPFSEEEEVFVEMVAACESWDDVLETTQAIQEYMAEKMEEMDTEDSHSGMFGRSSQDSLSSMDSDDSDPDGSDDDSGDDGQYDDDAGNPYSGDYNDSEDLLPEDLVTTQENFDRKMENLTPTGHDNIEIRYFTSPEPNLKNIVVSYKDVIKELGDRCALNDRIERQMVAETGNGRRLRRKYDYATGTYTTLPMGDVSEFNTFKRQSMKIVGYMAKEFERKKSAQEYRKESVAKTGVLDMGKIHSYKYNDDLFLRNTIRPDGKNHGVVMLVDWSASMSGHLFDTMKQILNLVWFCQKVNIPYEVYAFSNSYERPETIACKIDTTAEAIQREIDMKVKRGDTWNYKIGSATLSGSFNLLNLFSSRMNAKESIKAQKLLWRRCVNERVENFGSFDLSSTPLLDGFCAMNKIIPNFQERYKLDVTNLIVLTDGEGNSRYDSVHGLEGYGSSLSMSRYHDTRMEDPMTKKVYKLKDMFNKHENWNGYGVEVLGSQRAIMAQLRDRYGINIIGIFLDGSGNRVSQRDLEKYLGWKQYNPKAHKEARVEIRKSGVAPLPCFGYDEFYLVPVKKIQDVEAELQIDENWTAGKIKNAFKKNQTQKFGNKVLVNRMMDIIA